MDMNRLESMSNAASDMHEDRAEIQFEFQTENKISTYTKRTLEHYLALARVNVTDSVLTTRIKKMEKEQNLVIARKGTGEKAPYALSRENLFEIAEDFGVKPHRAFEKRAFVSIFQNLKGGVGKSLATAIAASGGLMHPKLILKQLRILIVDLDPQATTTEFACPKLKKGSTLSSIDCMIEDYTREELLEEAVVKTDQLNLDIIACNTDDAFNIAQLREPGIIDQHNPNDLIRKRIVEPLQYDYDFIFLDCGPHMDEVMKNAIGASDGIFVPVPPTYYSFQSSMTFISGMTSVINDMVKNDGYDLKQLSFIKGFVTRDSTHMAGKKHRNTIVTTVKDDLKYVFGKEHVLKCSLKDEEAYERSVEYGCTIFTMDKNKYLGSETTFKRALSEASDWVEEIFEELIDYQKGV